jgi:hypothetical protein
MASGIRIHPAEATTERRDVLRTVETASGSVWAVAAPVAAKRVRPAIRNRFMAWGSLDVGRPSHLTGSNPVGKKGVAM